MALHLKFISDGEYADDHFLDAMVYEHANKKYCVIITEERILIVDALTKDKFKDFLAADIHSIEVRPVYSQEEQDIID